MINSPTLFYERLGSDNDGNRGHIFRNTSNGNEIRSDRSAPPVRLRLFVCRRLLLRQPEQTGFGHLSSQTQTPPIRGDDRRSPRVPPSFDGRREPDEDGKDLSHRTLPVTWRRHCLLPQERRLLLSSKEDHWLQQRGWRLSAVDNYPHILQCFYPQCSINCLTQCRVSLFILHCFNGVEWCNVRTYRRSYVCPNVRLRNEEVTGKGKTWKPSVL